MGTWGYGLLDGDAALDIVELWEEYFSQPSYGHTFVEEKCFGRWGDAVKYGDYITNTEILALVALHLDNNIPLSKRLKKTATDAINRELVDDELENFKDPQKRKKILLDLLKTLGGKRRKPSKPRMFRDPALQYRNTEHARKELLRIVKEADGMPWITYIICKLYFPSQLRKNLNAKIPPFLKTLDRYMKHRVREKDGNIIHQAKVERLMMLATFLGVSIKMSEDEIVNLLDRCDIMKD